MKNENNYDFRKALRSVHLLNRRNFKIKPAKNEVEIDSSWSIIFSKKASVLIVDAAKDLQDYFFTSMEISLRLERVNSIVDVASKGQKCIVLTSKVESAKLGRGLSVPRSYILQVDGDKVVICGNDERGVMAGCHYLEDIFNLKSAPVLQSKCKEKREPIFSPRMVHSGWGLDQYPDFHLNAIAHAGFDSILLFVKGLNQTTHGYLDFNDLIDRAASFGIDVYYYSYLDGFKHPDDSDSEEFFDKNYGELFRCCPGAKGIFLVGESCEFPSKDTKTTGKKWHESIKDGIADTKPSPGWWPCYDYPKWINAVKKAIRKQKADAEIVLGTYNWGWTPKKERIKFIESLDPDITLQVFWEMFETNERKNVINKVMDYTISTPGPGKYFISEAKIAKKRGIRLFTMSNTAGMTWDFGAVPYIPTPYQWMKRYDGLHLANRKWNLTGLMESHHYGWWLSPICELSKWSFWSPAVDLNKKLEEIAKRDFGNEAAGDFLKGWQLWSEAITHYVPSNEDQYGPFRCGPSYPLLFHPNITRTMASKEIRFPTVPYAHHGGTIIETFYQPFENFQQTSGPVRAAAELADLEKLHQIWSDGVTVMEKAIKKVPSKKHAYANETIGLGVFIRNSILTAMNAKNWWVVNQKLLAEPDGDKAVKMLDKLEIIARCEIQNAQNTIPVVEANSRLGWEPSMEYVTDKWHLEWKIKQVKNVLENEIPVYRKIVKLSPL